MEVWRVVPASLLSICLSVTWAIPAGTHAEERAAGKGHVLWVEHGILDLRDLF